MVQRREKSGPQNVGFFVSLLWLLFILDVGCCSMLAGSRKMENRGGRSN